jgi:hypothetical protein
MPLSMSADTERGFLDLFLSDSRRLDKVLAAARHLDLDGAAGLYRDRAETAKECLLRLLVALGNAPDSGRTRSEDLRRLRSSARRAIAIRQRLTDPELWRDVFAQAGLDLPSPVRVEYADPQGRCNYTLRVSAGQRHFVVRYHDPIGREFLQRAEPLQVIRTSLLVEHVCRLAIGASRTLETLYPALERVETEAPIDERTADLASVVRSRVYIQDDYAIDHTLLSVVMDGATSAGLGALVDIFAEPLALLHARTHHVGDERGGSLSDVHALVGRYRSMLRFPTHDAYGEWLGGSNWISRRVLAGFDDQPDDRIVPGVLRTIGANRHGVLRAVRALWEASAAAMQRLGTLVHLDHNPRNCFVPNDPRCARTARIFDFDYLAIADPAYDVGLAAFAFVRAALRRRLVGTYDQVVDLVEQFMLSYLRFHQSASGGGAATHVSESERESLVQRARCFAALAFIATYYDLSRTARRSTSEPLPSPATFDAVSQACGLLLARSL